MPPIKIAGRDDVWVSYGSHNGYKNDYLGPFISRRAGRRETRFVRAWISDDWDLI